jgi:hypothetical protein
MKKLFLITIMALVCLVAGAGELDWFVLEVENVKTNTSAVAGSTETNITAIGMLYAIVFDISGYGSPTCDIDLVTKEDRGAMIPRTLYSADSVATTNFTVYPRVEPHTTAGTVTATNEAVMIPLVGDQVELSAYDANTNQAFDVKATIILVK